MSQTHIMSEWNPFSRSLRRVVLFNLLAALSNCTTMFLIPSLVFLCKSSLFCRCEGATFSSIITLSIFATHTHTTTTTRGVGIFFSLDRRRLYYDCHMLWLIIGTLFPSIILHFYRCNLIDVILSFIWFSLLDFMTLHTHISLEKLPLALVRLKLDLSLEITNFFHQFYFFSDEICLQLLNIYSINITFYAHELIKWCLNILWLKNYQEDWMEAVKMLGDGKYSN